MTIKGGLQEVADGMQMRLVGTLLKAEEGLNDPVVGLVQSFLKLVRNI